MGISLRLLALQSLSMVVLAATQDTGRQRRFILEAFTCPTLTSVAHGTLKCTHGNTLQSTCTTTCASGFKAVHSKVTCTYHGDQRKSIWSATPSCKVNRCPSPPSVSNGALHCPASTHPIGQVCTLSCTTGHRYTSSNTAYHSIHCLSTGAWSTHTTCTEIRCPAPSKISHGSYSCSPSTVHKYGQKCSLTCSAGFKPNRPTHTITCLATSKWSTLASCVEIRCPTPPKVTAGSYQCSSATTHKLNDACHLHCSVGYKPSTTRSDIKCQSTSVWSTPATCVEIICPTPPKVTAGSYRCSSTTTHKLNDACHLHCNVGYKPSTARSDIKCLSTSAWSTPAKCVEIICPPPAKVTHGAYWCGSATTHRLNDVCNLHCNPGYRPSSTTSDIHCLTTDTWSTAATCVEIRCPTPAAPLHSTFQCSPATVHAIGSTCIVTCSTGYLPSVHKISCLSDSTWSASPVCSAIRCPTPKAPQHGSYRCAPSSTPHKPEDTCSLTCTSGYTPSVHTITCLTDATWSAVPSCTQIRCPRPAAVPHGSYKCLSATVHTQGDTCTLTCTTGYRPSNSTHTITCRSDATWTLSATCVETRCAAPPTVTGGSYKCASATVHKMNDVCRLHCNTGYKPSTSDTDITCQSNRAWSTPSACVEIRCPTPPKVSHGTYLCASTTVHRQDDVCHLRCSSGYKPSSASSDVRCLLHGAWSPVVPCVEIRCPSPPAAAHGSLNCSSTDHEIGTTCNLTCAEGYQPRVHTITCLPDATWSETTACTDSHCPSPPTVQHGVFRCSFTHGHYHGDTCDLLCDTGYRPSSSDQIISCRSDNSWSPSTTCVEITCPSPLPVTNGSLKCSSMTTYKEGDTCRLSCVDGYRPSVHTVTCLADATWSNTAMCNEILCPPPPVTPHASFNCPSPATHKLGDTCTLSCSPGYRPLLHNISCLPDSTWSDSTFCVDNTPPVIHCPVGQTIALLPNETATNITWPEVTATDFPSGDSIPVTLTSNIRPGSNVTVGAYTVTYVAVDEAGNRAKPCSFLVIVSSSCPPGSHLSVTERQCRPCPVGMFQQHEDSLSCVPCPQGFSTSSEGSSLPSSCRGTCGAGSYSSDGLEPCSLCPLGTYQATPGSTQCHHCPQGQTSHEGANNKQDCSQSFT